MAVRLGIEFLQLLRREGTRGAGGGIEVEELPKGEAFGKAGISPGNNLRVPSVSSFDSQFPNMSLFPFQQFINLFLLPHYTP